MPKKKYLSSLEMAQMLKPLAQMLMLYKPIVSELPTKDRKQEQELMALYNALDNSYRALNNLVDMNDRTWEIAVHIHETEE